MPPNGGPHVAKFPRGWGPERGDTRTELTAGALQAVTHLLLEAPAPPPIFQTRKHVQGDLFSVPAAATIMLGKNKAAQRPSTSLTLTQRS